MWTDTHYVAIIQSNYEIIARGNVNKTKQKHAELYQNMLDNYMALELSHAHTYIPNSKRIDGLGNAISCKT